MKRWEGRRGRGRPPSDFRAGIPKSALDFVTSPRIRYQPDRLEGRKCVEKEADKHVEQLRFGTEMTERSCCSHSKMDTIGSTVTVLIVRFTPSLLPPAVCPCVDVRCHCFYSFTPISDPLLSDSLFSVSPSHSRRLWVFEEGKDAALLPLVSFIPSSSSFSCFSICCNLFCVSAFRSVRLQAAAAAAADAGEEERKEELAA